MPIKIAVDAMGGDFAPTEVIKGVLQVARERADIEIILVGARATVEAALSAEGDVPSTVTVRDAMQVIGMGEHPVLATRRKRDASLVIAGLMVRDGEVDATFSAGNTGATMAVATLDMGRLSGIDRPALATTLPTLQGRALVLDAGANVDCAPRNLLQFALMGAVYAARVMGRPQPKIGLLNIGGEEGKGNEQTKAAFELLRAAPLNFVGNVEGKDVFEHAADVVVCDGFVGNILLKSGEGVAELILDILQHELNDDPQVKESQEVFAPIFRRLLARMDYSEFGGAPLLGVNGISFVGHGRSNAKAIASGVRSTAVAAGSDYVNAIRDSLPGFEAKS